MSSPFVGEIRLVAFNFAPENWEFCNGQLLSISQNDVLFALLGTTYGGDGVQTFGLPNLCGRAALHQGTANATNFIAGQASGTESVTLTASTIPAHNHPVYFSTDTGTQPSPTGNYLGASGDGQYAASGSLTTGGILQSAGSSLSHENRQPFLCVNYIISLYGIFPSQN